MLISCPVRRSLSAALFTIEKALYSVEAADFFCLSSSFHRDHLGWCSDEPNQNSVFQVLRKLNKILTSAPPTSYFFVAKTDHDGNFKKKKPFLLALSSFLLLCISLCTCAPQHGQMSICKLVFFYHVGPEGRTIGHQVYSTGYLLRYLTDPSISVKFINDFC